MASLMISLVLLNIACAVQQSTSNSSAETHAEDLRMERIKFEEEPKKDVSAANVPESKDPHKNIPATQTVNVKVDSVLDSLDRLNQYRTFVDGFTIQIYSGQNREEAIGAKSKMVMEANDLDASVQYTQPKFRVTSGQYYSKLEAQKDLLRIRKLFPNAILIPEKISIK